MNRGTAGSRAQPGAPLDADTPGTVRLTVAQATALGENALRRIGYPEEEARIIVDQLVDNALCGYKFAGLPRVLAIAHDEKTRQARRPVRVVHETPASALIDGGNNVGYISVYRGAEIAIAKARATGLAAVGVYNSYYSGRNAYYAERIARAGLVAIHVASAKPRVLPLGGARPALGTNPICFGFPSAAGPVVFDMGTASLMWGEVMLFAHIGRELPEGTGYDEQGRPTRDARAVLRGGVVPFGGHKGYGLSFAIQALGLLAGAALARGQVQDYGFLFVAVDPDILVPGGVFPRQMAELVERVKATPRQPGVAEIRIPSERAFRERERRRKEGIVLDRKVVESLEAL
ncbi:MAG: Ldh family oxidoreductase [Betaproteobacteria bacterium]|nr:Ldh family oxidoreductase [Betaproteobacteria bacterium]